AALQTVVESELDALGYGLVLLRRGGTRSRPVLEIRIQRRDGQPVSIGDCVRASRAVEARLDAAGDVGSELTGSRYELQVSSPGDARRAQAVDAQAVDAHAADTHVDEAGPRIARERTEMPRVGGASDRAPRG